MVGLGDVAAGNEDIRHYRQGFAYKELKLPNLVTPEGKAGHVIAFDQNSRAA
jgi:hypothetical protein